MYPSRSIVKTSIVRRNLNILDGCWMKRTTITMRLTGSFNGLANWGRVGRILANQTTDPRVRGYFYKAILQAILLYGSESWVISKYKLNQLRSFHHRVARYITGRHIKKRPDGTYECPPTSETLEMAGLYPLETYIERRRQTVWQAVKNRPILERCRNSTALSTTRRRNTWWDNFL